MKTLCRPQDRFPFVGRGGNGQMDRLALLLGQFKRPRKKRLLLEAEQLLGSELVLPAAGSLQKAQMKNNDVLLAGVHTLEHCLEVVQAVVVPRGHQDAARPYAERFRREILARREVELIELGMRRRALSSTSLRE